MSYGWSLAWIIIALFIGGILVEGIRVPRVEAWCRRNGFSRLDSMSEETRTQLNLLARRFGDYYISKWGFSLAGGPSGMTVTIAEHHLNLDINRSNWFILAALVRPGSELPEFRLESRDQVVRDFPAFIEIPLYPFRYLSRQHDWKWSQKGLPPVDFPEDADFDQSFRVCGDMLAAKSVLDPIMRAKLVRHEWKGQLVASGDAILWRRKGLLWPSRLDRVLEEIDLFREILPRF